MLLSGKTAIISGAAGPRGIGFAAARLFAEQGARVAIFDIDQRAAEAAAEGLGSDHLGLGCDVTDLAACKRSTAEAVDRFGNIDVLINNAEITQPVKFMDIDQASWQRLQYRRQSDRGAQSLAGRRASHARAQERIHRLHVIGVCATWRRNLRRPALLGRQGWGPRARQGDGARTVAGQHSRQLRDPELIQTDITGGKLTDEMKSEIIRGIPLGRLGTAEEVARTYLLPRLRSFFLHDRRRYRRQRRHAHSLGNSAMTTTLVGHNRPLYEKAQAIRRTALEMGKVQGRGYIAQALDVADIFGGEHISMR